MVLTNSRRVSRVPQYLGVRPRKTVCFRLQDCHLLWSAVPGCSANALFCNFPRIPENPLVGSHDPEHTTLPGLHMLGLGCSPFARRYWGNHCCFLFLGLLRCFSSSRSPLQSMNSIADVPALPGTGLPIQKSPDQSLFSSSPKLIAAYHVFHRILAPRHPPFALSSLATIFIVLPENTMNV